ncbi:protein Wnt-9a-like [Ornithodoros turicata]|uniref:protein Wnt-9a-like n=1 Tax=Ornithodoros turicata TaxID=34597 RepID=UPI003138E889
MDTALSDMQALQAPMGATGFIRLLFGFWLCCQLCETVGLRRMLSVWPPERKERNLSMVESFCTAVKRRGPWLRRMCRHTPALAEVVAQGLQQGLDACRSQFRDERWDCDLRQRRRREIISRKVYRETAVLYATTAASLTHTLARACSAGRLLRRCSCDDESQGPAANRDAWRWGGCSDNYHYAAKFSRRLLADTYEIRRKANRKPKCHVGYREPVDRHNIGVGVRILRRDHREVCRCHGMSGSCSVKTCWNRLGSYEAAAAALKKKYKKAVVANILENQTGARNSTFALKARDKLLYLHESPSFCDGNPLSSGTRERSCEAENCDFLCCGRGYNSFQNTFTEQCHCRVKWCCNVQCQSCTVQRQVNTCK